MKWGAPPGPEPADPTNQWNHLTRRPRVSARGGEFSGVLLGVATKRPAITEVTTGRTVRIYGPG